MESKQSLAQSIFPTIAEINHITMYSDNEYSFYVGDDIDPRTTSLFVGYGDSVDYLNKALLSWDKQLTEIPGSNYFQEIILNEPERKIYGATGKADFTLMNRFENVYIWVSVGVPSFVEELYLSHSILDLITYWLSECKGIIERIVLKINFCM